jgi:hypothetical protein
LITIFPHNPSVGQQINIHFEGKKYQAWGFHKGNYDVNGELDGMPLKLICDLNASEQRHKVNSFKNYFRMCEVN